MKATELRIGNWVKESISGIDGIITWELLRIIAENQNHTYKPIPLTDDWLDRLGFHNGGYDQLFWTDGNKYLDGNIEISGTDYLRNGIDDTAPVHAWNWYDENSKDGKHFQITLSYVHELQNLYFALTGTELAFK